MTKRNETRRDTPLYTDAAISRLEAEKTVRGMAFVPTRKALRHRLIEAARECRRRRETGADGPQTGEAV